MTVWTTQKRRMAAILAPRSSRFQPLCRPTPLGGPSPSQGPTPGAVGAAEPPASRLSGLLSVVFTTAAVLAFPGIIALAAVGLLPPVAATVVGGVAAAYRAGAEAEQRHPARCRGCRLCRRSRRAASRASARGCCLGRRCRLRGRPGDDASSEVGDRAGGSEGHAAGWRCFTCAGPYRPRDPVARRAPPAEQRFNNESARAQDRDAVTNPSRAAMPMRMCRLDSRLRG